MRKILVNFLFGRGIGKVQEVVSKAVRHGITTYGGALVMHGHLMQDDVTLLQGAGAVVVGALLSVARSFIAPRLTA